MTDNTTSSMTGAGSECLPFGPAEYLTEVATRSSVSVGQILTDEQGNILSANARAHALFDSAGGDLVGSPITALFPVDRRDELVGQIGELSVAGRSHVDDPEREPVQWSSLGLQPNGITLPILITADCVQVEQRSVLVFSITKFQAGDREQDEVVTASEQLRQFAYLASHDLRSPLAKISTLVRWLHEDLDVGAIGATNAENLARLGHQVKRMETLMSGLLDYARAGGSRERAVDLDLDRFLYEVVELAHVPDGFDVVWPDRMPSIQSQPTPLQHTLLNLINNAVEHHDRDCGTIRIECDFVSPGRIEFAVEDDGPGIPERQRDRVFDIFHTLGDSRTRKDRGGIGLAIVKRLVTRAGGTVRALAARGDRGTRVVFSWPSASI